MFTLGESIVVTLTLEKHLLNHACLYDHQHSEWFGVMNIDIGGLMHSASTKSGSRKFTKTVPTFYKSCYLLNG